RRERARKHHHEIAAHGVDLALDPLGRPLADRHHRDDARNADYDAQHREERAHLVAPERPDGQQDRGERVHAAPSWLSPSRIRIVRRAWSAISTFCVTWITVRTTTFCSWKQSRPSLSSFVSHIHVCT